MIQQPKVVIEFTCLPEVLGKTQKVYFNSISDLINAYRGNCEMLTEVDRGLSEAKYLCNLRMKEACGGKIATEPVTPLG